MATSRQQRKVEKKTAARLTKEQRRQQAELQAQEKELENAANAYKEKSDAVNALRRKLVMDGVKSFGLSTAELDAFVSGLDGFAQKTDLARAIIGAAASSKTVDMQSFHTKLVRLGFV